VQAKVLILKSPTEVDELKPGSGRLKEA